MFQCIRCKATFEDPDCINVCYESEYGVASMFQDMHYGNTAVCPECGCDELDEFYCDEDCEECSYYRECTLPERVTRIANSESW